MTDSINLQNFGLNPEKLPLNPDDVAEIFLGKSHEKIIWGESNAIHSDFWESVKLQMLHGHIIEMLEKKTSDKKLIFGKSYFYLSDSVKSNTQLKAAIYFSHALLQEHIQGLEFIEVSDPLNPPDKTQQVHRYHMTDDTYIKETFGENLFKGDAAHILGRNVVAFNSKSPLIELVSKMHVTVDSDDFKNMPLKSILLNRECDKFVEFAFSSHIFPVVCHEVLHKTLGHPGAYNDTLENIAEQTFFNFDHKANTIMSYHSDSFVPATLGTIDYRLIAETNSLKPAFSSDTVYYLKPFNSKEPSPFYLTQEIMSSIRRDVPIDVVHYTGPLHTCIRDTGGKNGIILDSVSDEGVMTVRGGLNPGNSIVGWRDKKPVFSATIAEQTRIHHLTLVGGGTRLALGDQTRSARFKDKLIAVLDGQKLAAPTFTVSLDSSCEGLVILDSVRETKLNAPQHTLSKAYQDSARNIHLLFSQGTGDTGKFFHLVTNESPTRFVAANSNLNLTTIPSNHWHVVKNQTEIISLKDVIDAAQLPAFLKNPETKFRLTVTTSLNGFPHLATRSYDNEEKGEYKMMNYGDTHKSPDTSHKTNLYCVKDLSLGKLGDYAVTSGRNLEASTMNFKIEYQAEGYYAEVSHGEFRFNAVGDSGKPYVNIANDTKLYLVSVKDLLISGNYDVSGSSDLRGGITYFSSKYAMYSSTETDPNLVKLNYDYRPGVRYLLKPKNLETTFIDLNSASEIHFNVSGSPIGTEKAEDLKKKLQAKQGYTLQLSLQDKSPDRGLLVPDNFKRPEFCGSHLGQLVG